MTQLYRAVASGDEVNVSACNKCSMQELITQICAMMDYRGEIRRMPRRGADVECHNATNAKMLSMIDFRPTSFAEGLHKTLQWYTEMRI